MGTPDDAALGLPPVMLGPDSTRTLDNLTKWGVRLHGPDKYGFFEWRNGGGSSYWSHRQSRWHPQPIGEDDCLYVRDEAEANPPTLPPPDWIPHDGTTPGHKPCRTDAASLDTHAKSVEGRQYAAKSGTLMRNVMTARARMFGLLATEEEKAAFLAWEEATNLWIDHIIEGGAH